jgi:hypothetical protein
MIQKNGALAPTGSACLGKARSYLFTLATAGGDLALLCILGALIWTA